MREQQLEKPEWEWHLVGPYKEELWERERERERERKTITVLLHLREKKKLSYLKCSFDKSEGRDMRLEIYQIILHHPLHSQSS